MSVKKVLKNELNPNPISHLKTGIGLAARDLRHKDPAEDPSVTQARIDQETQLAELNDEENYKRKALLNSAGGLRVYRGSAQDRATQAPTPVTSAAPAGTGSAGRMFINGGRSVPSFGTLL